jgi:hypothetical protein
MRMILSENRFPFFRIMRSNKTGVNGMRGILAGFAALLAAGKHLWIPVLNVAMYTTSSKKLKGVRPHMLYQNTFYKGLDYSF